MTKAALKGQRTAQTQRTTKETDVLVRVNLDQSGESDIETSLPFLSHMLAALATHGRFSLYVRATGDIEVDPHHLIEDTGIVLGETIFQALGGLTGIQRAGCFTFPMDGSLAHLAIDLCGRRNLTWHVEFSNFPIGNLDPNLFREFFKGLVDGLKATVHVNLQYRDNDHHSIEAIFKALSRALRQAIEILPGQELLSTKGSFDES